MNQTLTVIDGSDMHVRSYPYGDSLSIRALKVGDKVSVAGTVKDKSDGMWYAVSTGGFVRADVLIPPESNAPVIANVKVTDISSEGYTVSCDVTDDTSVTTVSFPTWTEANGQDDLVKPWHSVTVNSAATETTHVSFTVHTADHNDETGKYFTHIYAYDPFVNKICVSQSIVSALAVEVPAPMHYWHSYATVSTSANEAQVSAKFSQLHNTAYDVTREMYLAMGGTDTTDVFYLFAGTSQSAVAGATPDSPGDTYYAVLEESTFYKEGNTVTDSVTGRLKGLKNASGKTLSPAGGTIYYYKFAVRSLGSVYDSSVKSVKTTAADAVWYNVKQDASTSSGAALFYGDVRFPNAYSPTAVGVYYAADRDAVSDATYSSHSGVSTLSDTGSSIPSSFSAYDSSHKYMSSFWRSNKVSLTPGVTYYFKFFARFSNGTVVYSAVTAYKPSTTAATYQLTLSAGEGGSITGASGKHAAGEVISLSAKANEGYELAGWSATADKLSGTASSSVSFTMPSSAAAVSASFRKTDYSLTVRNADGSADGVDTSADGAQYHMGDQVALSAAPAEGLRFVRWISNNGGVFADSESAQTTFTMPAGNVVIVAEFAPSDTYHTVTVEISGSGEVKDGVSGRYASGDRVVLEATPRHELVLQHLAHGRRGHRQPHLPADLLHHARSRRGDHRRFQRRGAWLDAGRFPGLRHPQGAVPSVLHRNHCLRGKRIGGLGANRLYLWQLERLEQLEQYQAKHPRH